MSEKKAVTVTIYKNEYTLKGDADSQHIIDLAKYVDGRMTEMGQKSSAPADKIAILVSMNIADELQRQEKKNEENLKLIENLEKTLDEFKNSSDNAVKNAAALNEQADQIRIQLSQEKERNQAAMDMKIKADGVAEAMKKQVAALTAELDQIKAGFNSTQTTTHELQSALEEQRKKTQDAENQCNQLKKSLESLEMELAAAREALAIAAKAPASTANGTAMISDDRFHFLIKKIETVLE